MFEPIEVPDSRSSAFEEALSRHLQAWAADGGIALVRASSATRVEWAWDSDGHGNGRLLAPTGTTTADDGADPGEDFLAGYLECGVAALDAVEAAELEVRNAEARRARAMAEFVRQRPEWLFDLPPGEKGAASAASRAARPAALADLSEWAVDEVAVRLRMTSRLATVQLKQAVVFAEKLPATLFALEAGRLSYRHAVALEEVVGPVADDAIRAKAEALLLDRLGHKSPTQLRAAAHRVVARLDAAAAAERVVAAVRSRQVRLHEGEDGMATLAAVLAGPVGQACYRALEAYAEACAVPGDERTKDQRMADCLVELILGTNSGGPPPVQVALTLVAGVDTLCGGDEPGELDGRTVPAVMVRELAYAFGLLPRPAPQPPRSPGAPQKDALPEERTESAIEPTVVEQTVEESPAGQVSTRGQGAGPASHVDSSADDVNSDRPLADLIADAEAALARAADDIARGALDAMLAGRWTDGEERRLLDIGALLATQRLTGTPLARRPHLAVVDRLRGTLLALTDASGLRAGSALGPPPPSDGYEPGAELDRFVRLRDRRCRFPGCRARPRRCDLDHECPYPHGPTAHDNLCCLCEHHHRLSHQAPGWAMWRTADGGLAWRSPDGRTTTTHPPPFGAADAPRSATDGDPPPF